MINPSRVHRSRAVITSISLGGGNFKVRVPSGYEIQGWDLPSKFKVGETVNIQAQFSICLTVIRSGLLTKYVLKT